ncbi:MAG: glycosyltransferase, partial [Gemmatimonadaceae bacterium]
PTLIDEWRKGSKIVHTVRLDTDRQSVFKKTTSRLFYRVYSALSGVNIDPGMADFRLLDRQVLDALLQFNEGGLFLRGLVQWVGFPSTRVPFHCRERYSGSTKYSVKKMVKLAWAAVTSFSLVPLRIAVVLGVITAFISFAFLVYATGSRIFLETHVVPGWASAVSVVSFLFGVLFVLLGVIGEYVGKILMEVKRRPRFMVQDGIGLATSRSDASPPDPLAAVVPDLGRHLPRTDRALLP